MPNIELHGFDKAEAFDVRGSIWAHMEWDSLGFRSEDVVLTTCPTEVCDFGGRNRPFLRLMCTDEEEMGKLKEALRPLGQDMECVILHDFVEGAQPPG